MGRGGWGALIQHALSAGLAHRFRGINRSAHVSLQEAKATREAKWQQQRARAAQEREERQQERAKRKQKFESESSTRQRFLQQERQRQRQAVEDDQHSLQVVAKLKEMVCAYVQYISFPKWKPARASRLRACVRACVCVCVCVFLSVYFFFGA